MKPTKNIFFCVACKRPKILFETQAKADNFIRYNKDEIEDENGKAPVRSYFCNICGGWHVTSNPSKESGEYFENRDEHLVKIADDFVKSKGDISPFIGDANRKIKDAELLIVQGRLSEAERLLNDCREVLAPFRYSNKSKRLKWCKIEILIKGILQKINFIRKMNDASKAEQEAYIMKEDKSEIEKECCQAFINYRILGKVKELLVEVDKDIQTERVEANDKLHKCRMALKNFSCPFKKELLLGIKKEIEDREAVAKSFSISEEPEKEKDYKKIYRKRKSNSDDKKTIIYVIEKFEKLKTEYESGNVDECENILEIIAMILDELPVNPDTDILRKQYKIWKNHFSAPTPRRK